MRNAGQVDRGKSVWCEVCPRLKLERGEVGLFIGTPGPIACPRARAHIAADQSQGPAALCREAFEPPFESLDLRAPLQPIVRLARMTSTQWSGPAATQTPIAAASGCAADLYRAERSTQMPEPPRRALPLNGRLRKLTLVSELRSISLHYRSRLCQCNVASWST